MRVTIRASYDSFRELRESGSYYVDKTEIIEDYLTRYFEKAILFARPRRFGKTVTMTMLRDFLDVRQESENLFRGLNIMTHAETVSKHMNRYPVVFMSLKEIYGENFEKTYSNFKLAAANLAGTFQELYTGEKVNRSDQTRLRSIENEEADEANTIAVLDLLSRMLHAFYGRQVFVIIDEYDVPMAKTHGTPAYDKTRDIIEHMLSFVCKTNDHVKGVILSGCLFTVKNSTYTGVNNIVPYTVLSPIYASSIGFTDGDVRKLLDDAGLSDRYDTVAEWYDGYLFGRDKMYCPWDVMRYVGSVLDGSYSEIMGPESYWINTSDTALDMIHGFLGKTAGVNESFERLLAGMTIDCAVNDNLPYHRIHENGDNLWSALLETGYLTKTVRERMPLMPLKIPNKEIQDVFRQEVWDYFRGRVDNVFVEDLVNALWAGEAEKAEKSLNQILEATLSYYHEYREYSYHLILDGFFTGRGYKVISELESGYGRSDLTILDPARNRCIILELKHAKEEADMLSALKEAGGQLAMKKYESELIYLGYKTRMRYSMAFFNKTSLIARV